MDKLYNIQQLKKCFGQQTKFYILDISKTIKLLDEIEQSLDDTIIWKLQAENKINFKYTPMEEHTECNQQEDNNLVFYHGTGEQDDPIQIDWLRRSEDEPYCILTVLLDGRGIGLLYVWCMFLILYMRFYA